MNSVKKRYLFFLACLFLCTQKTDAASFLLSPFTGDYSVGDRFTVSVLVNTTEAINAGVGQISFDNSRLVVESIQRSTSLFTLWTEEPVFSNAKGTITFSGGVPNPGYVGVSGNVFQVVFKVKAEGVATVRFVSGSILVNDGKGTNALDGFGSAEFRLVPAKSAPTPVQSEIKPDSVLDLEMVDKAKAKKILDIPSVTTWPGTLSVGDTLMIRGLGIPQAKVKISIQKDNEVSISAETYTASDGRFLFTYQKPVEEGHYRVSFQNEFEGEMSASSEQVLISVLPSPFFQIGSLFFSYFSLVVVFAALLLLVILLFVASFVIYQKWRREENEQISHTENMVHKLFDLLKDGIRGYTGRLKPNTEKEIEGEIDKIEKEIEKSIKTIKK